MPQIMAGPVPCTKTMKGLCPFDDDEGPLPITNMEINEQGLCRAQGWLWACARWNEGPVPDELKGPVPDDRNHTKHEVREGLCPKAFQTITERVASYTTMA